MDLTGNLSEINYQGPGAKWDIDRLLDAGVTISDDIKDAFNAIGIIKEELNTTEVACLQILEVLRALAGAKDP